MRSRTSLLALGLGVMLLLVPPAASASPPTITYTIDGIRGTNGWYRGSTGGNYVVLHWRISSLQNVKSTPGCEQAIPINGPTTGTTRTCTVYMTDGSFVGRTTDPPIKIDATPPTGVTASLSRGADFNGWYNHPVGITWRGSDATSGIAGCTARAFSGPEGAWARVSGGCTDRAGNTSLVPVALNYDATSPALARVFVTSGAKVDVVHWSSTSPSDTIVVQRAARGSKGQQTVFRGSGASFADKKIRIGLEYAYSVQAYDQAGNASRKISVAGLPKVLTLRKTPYVPRAARKPILRWPGLKGARYYHVQLFRGSKRIFAAWPSRPELGLPTAWKWSGHRYRLVHGRYRWYVWAGMGRRSFAHYKTLGSAKFIVPRHQP
jgi:hypothetical protein